MPKKLLIVSHVFPPAPGIGGRRWAKFAKYLHRKGYDITVLTAETISNSVSEWADDAKGLKIETLPFRFPKIVANPANGIFKKLSYYVWVGILKLVERGNYFDKTIFWKKQITKKIAGLIEENSIDCVIVTGGPFRLTNHVMRLRKKYPKVKFIADFRDLWTEDSEITFFSVMSYRRKRIEKKIERETILMADKVITTIDSITNYFSSLSVADKFVTISNGFDPEDYNDIKDEPAADPDKIRFVYAGTLYINLQYIIKPLFKAIGEIKRKEPELYNKIEFHFIGKFPQEYKNFIQENEIQDAIKVLDFLPLKTVFQKIKRSDYGLLILNDVYNFSLSTKFFEYISQKKKVVVVSKKGSASEFIVNNKLGYWFDPLNCYNDLVTLLKSNVNKTIPQWDSNYDIGQFSINSLTNKLIDVIEEKFEPGGLLNKKNILLTFDYELFLGKKSGTVHNCILKPTEYLLAILDKYNFKNAIFFADTTYIKKLTESDEPECKTDLNKIKEQLVSVIRKGHFVFPHLHPHWRDAIYDKDINQWRLEKADSYRFHVIPEEERDGLFAFSIRFIKELMQDAGTSYHIDSFRAGGWCLQPFATYKPYFEKYGIKNDFSVLRGFNLPGKNIFYDYSNIPLRNIYKFTNLVEQEVKDGAFNEIVISTISISNINRLLNKFLYKYLWYIKKTSFGDGYSAVDGEASVIRSIQNVEETTKNKPEMVSIELMTFFTNSHYKELIRDNDFMHFISHPKMFNRHNLDTLDSFLKHATSGYEINSDYRKIIN